MKKLETIVVLVLVFGFIACNQNSNNNQTTPTKSLEEKFTELYPDAKNVKWEQEGDFKVVEFEENGTEKEIAYDSLGVVVSTETEISTESLSDSIINYFEKNYDHFTYLEAEIIENNEGIFYEVELKIDNKEVEFIFDEDGNFIKEEIEDDNDSDDDTDDDIKKDEVEQDID